MIHAIDECFISRRENICTTVIRQTVRVSPGSALLDSRVQRKTCQIDIDLCSTTATAATVTGTVMPHSSASDVRASSHPRSGLFGRVRHTHKHRKHTPGRHSAVGVALINRTDWHGGNAEVF